MEPEKGIERKVFLIGIGCIALVLVEPEKGIESLHYQAIQVLCTSTRGTRERD